jgi:hypothetical protein
MPALLVAGVLAAPAQAATPAQSDQLCILGICIGPTPTPSPSASASATPTPSTGSSSSASPQPGTGGSGSGTASPGASASSSASGKAKTAKGAKAKQVSSGALEGSTSTSTLTAGSSTLDDFTFVGIVNMPVDGGTEKMLKFTASPADLTDGVTVTITEQGHTLTTSNTALTTTGGLTLYATKLTGTIEGIVGPLTFTPTTIDALLLKVTDLVTGLIPITMTNVSIDQFLMIGGTQQWFNTSQGF